MKFIDENGVIWVMEPSPYGGVWMHVPECDNEFDEPYENGYIYPNEIACLMDMEKSYGVMTPLTK
jgi:hypothetical protein